MELIVFTHNDLDALGCMLNIEYKWPDVRKKYYHTNYANIDEIVDEILLYQARNGNTHLLIPDVSFSDNKPALTELYKAFDHVTHIDHHMYPDGFWDDYPNMKVVHDKSKSATLLCNEYFGNKGQNENLDKLSYIIDIYDLWQVKSPHFNVAQDMNEYFWRTEKVDLLYPIIDNGWKLPKNYTEVVQQLHSEFDGAIASYEKRNLIHRSGDVTVAFVQDYFNQILIREMNNGQNFVIGVNPYGITKIRVNQDSPYTDDQLNALRFALTGSHNYGHLHAFTYKVEAQGFEAIMAEIQKISKAIEEICHV